jgi:hypothetical protein
MADDIHEHKIKGLLKWGAGVVAALMAVPLLGTAWAKGDLLGQAQEPVPYYEDGEDVTDRMPEFTGLMRLDGKGLETCPDGNPVRVPNGGIPEDIPVVSLTGVEYDSMAEAASASQQRVQAAANGDDQDGVTVFEEGDAEVVEIGDSEKFRPDVGALCDRYGSALELIQ